MLGRVVNVRKYLRSYNYDWGKYIFSCNYHTLDSCGKVYFIATPIGNMADITYRAVELLKHVDILYAEDTRRTKILLRYLEINKSHLWSYHDHNYKSQIPKIIEMLKDGKNIGLVSDAGWLGVVDVSIP